MPPSPELPAAPGAPAFARLEDEHLWPRVWTCIGATAQIPTPGDLLPYTIGVHGIHVQRDATGGLTARLNKAQHGGCHAIPLQCQTGRKTRCGFTSCGFSLDRPPIQAGPDGEEVPAAYQYLGMRPDRLPVLSLAERAGLLFVAIDPAPGEAPPELPSLPPHAVAAGWLTFDGNWTTIAAALAAEGSDPLVHAAAWHPPNLLLLAGADATCAVLVQPVAPTRTLCRPILFTAAPADPEPWLAWIKQRADRPGTLPPAMQRWLTDRLPAEPPAAIPRPDSAYRSHARFNVVA